MELVVDTPWKIPTHQGRVPFLQEEHPHDFPMATMVLVPVPTMSAWVCIQSFPTGTLKDK